MAEDVWQLTFNRENIKVEQKIVVQEYRARIHSLGRASECTGMLTDATMRPGSLSTAFRTFSSG